MTPLRQAVSNPSIVCRLVCLHKPPEAFHFQPIGRLAESSSTSGMAHRRIPFGHVGPSKKVIEPIVRAMVMGLSNMHPQVAGLGVEGGAFKSLLTIAWLKPRRVPSSSITGRSTVWVLPVR